MIKLLDAVISLLWRHLTVIITSMCTPTAVQAHRPCPAVSGSQPLVTPFSDVGLETRDFCVFLCLLVSVDRYSSPVWSPSTVTYINKLESVQRSLPKGFRDVCQCRDFRVHVCQLA